MAKWRNGEILAKWRKMAKWRNGENGEMAKNFRMKKKGYNKENL